MEISWAPIWGWMTTSLLGLGLLLLVLLTYPARVRHLPKAQQRSLLTLRLLSTLVLLVAMFRPSLKYATSDDSDTVISFLYDDSRSMTTKDAPENQTRREHLVKVRTGVEEEIKRLKDELTVREFEFGDQLTPVTAMPLSSEAPGMQTPLGGSLEKLLEQSSGEPLKAVFMLSDGAERSLPPLNRSPRSAAMELAKRGIPLYTVPFGTTSSIDRGLDLVVDELSIDPVVFEKKTIPVRAVLRVSGATSQPYQVKLLVEDRTGKRIGESGPMRQPPMSRTDRTELTIPNVPSGQSVPLEFTYTPTQAGEIKIGIEVTPVEGEVQTGNNRRESLTTVRGGGLKVAYFDVLRNEVKFIRSLNTSSNIQVDFQLISINKGQLMTPINPAMIETENYDVYIIGDVPASAFGNALLQKLAEKVRAGSGLLMIGGYHNFSAGGYANTPIADWLPVALDASKVTPPDRIDNSQQVVGEVTIEATDAGLRHYVMLIDAPEQNAAAWASLPPLTGINRLKPKSDVVEVLARTSSGDPLFIAADVGRSRSVALATDETYYWYLAGQPQKHQRFWRQLILWLSHKEFESDQSIWVRLDQRNVSPGSEVEATYGVRGPDGSAIQDATFKVSLVPPAGGEAKTVPSQRSNDFARSMIGETQTAGDYWLSVEASRGGTSMGLPGVSRFIVDQRDLEMDNPTADPALLAQLSEITAELTDGQLIPPEEFPEFLKNFVKRKPWKADLEASERINLWDGWPVLLIFVGVLSAEWILRKRMELT